MRDEFAFLRPAILLAASVLVFGVGSRAFREAGEQRAQMVAAMRAATNGALARSVSAPGTDPVSGVCPKACSEGAEHVQSTNVDGVQVH